MKGKKKTKRSTRYRLELLLAIFLTALVIVFTMVFAVFVFQTSEKDMFSFLMNTVGMSYDGSRIFLILLYAALSLIITLFVFLILYFAFISPLYKLANAAQKVENGDYSVRLEKKAGIGLVSRTYNNFNHMCEKLSSVNAMQNDFTAMVSHEMKTPLSVINGLTSVLEDESLSEEERRHCIEGIAENTNRLSSMVDDILMLSRLEHDEQKLNEERYNLSSQIRKIMQALENRWSEKNLNIALSLGNISIEADETLLYHVWYNLIANAVKFSNDGGDIKVSCRVIKGGGAVFSVSDNGPGIKAEDKERIFEKFYKSSGTGKVGNGLGLALVKQILDICGGEIEVESAPQKGSTFTVTLNNCSALDEEI